MTDYRQFCLHFVCELLSYKCSDTYPLHRLTLEKHGLKNRPGEQTPERFF